jgi:hypothetical protein
MAARGRPPIEPKAAHCTAEGCAGPIVGRNLCMRHYQQSRRPPRCPKGPRHLWTVLNTCRACGAIRT